MPNPQILIADDRTSNREFVRTVLERLGYTVEEAQDGIEALNAIRERTPQLVLLDLQMPGLTGSQVLEEVRKDGRFQNLPVVALTASAMAGDRERALASGFTSYLAKPVSVSMLRAEVARLLGAT